MADLFVRLATRARELGPPAVLPRLSARFENDEVAPRDHDHHGLSDVERPGSGRGGAGRNELADGIRVATAQIGGVVVPGSAEGHVSGEPLPGSVAEKAMVRPAARLAAGARVLLRAGLDRGSDDGSKPDDLPTLLRPDQTVQYGHNDDQHEQSAGSMSAVGRAQSRIRPVVQGVADLVPPNESALKPDVRQPAKPDVHISIGRIEVRMVPTTPAPPAPKVIPPAPEESGLSLAAYLRGDDGRPR